MDESFDAIGPGAANLRIVSKGFRADATTSNIWHGSKLSCLELESRCAMSGGRDHKEHSLNVAVAGNWADFQRADRGNAPFMRALMRKRLFSLGCKLWEPNGCPPDAAKTHFVAQEQDTASLSQVDRADSTLPDGALLSIAF